MAQCDLELRSSNDKRGVVSGINVSQSSCFNMLEGLFADERSPQPCNSLVETTRQHTSNLMLGRFWRPDSCSAVPVQGILMICFRLYYDAMQHSLSSRGVWSLRLLREYFDPGSKLRSQLASSVHNGNYAHEAEDERLSFIRQFVYYVCIYLRGPSLSMLPDCDPPRMSHDRIRASATPTDWSPVRIDE